MSAKNCLISIFIFMLGLTPLVKPTLHHIYKDELQAKRDCLKQIEELSRLKSTSEVDPWGNPWKGGMCYSWSTGPNGVDENGGGDDIMFGGPWKIVWGPRIVLCEKAPCHYLVLVSSCFIAVILTFKLRASSKGKDWFGTVMAAVPLATSLLWIVHDTNVTGSLESRYLGWLLTDSSAGTTISSAVLWPVKPLLWFGVACLALVSVTVLKKALNRYQPFPATLEAMGSEPRGF